MEVKGAPAPGLHRLIRPGLKRPRSSKKLLEEETDDRMWYRRQPVGVVDRARHPSLDLDLEHRQMGKGALAADAEAGCVGTRRKWESSSTDGIHRRCTSSRGQTVHGRRRAATTIVVALATALAAAGTSTATSPLLREHQHQSLWSVTTALSSRLCSPAEDSRAYVTTIGANEGGGSNGFGDERGDSLQWARVLAKSLRSAGAKGDVVVLVPKDKATRPTVDALRRDGLTVQIVPRGLQSADGSVVSEELMTKVSLWSLTAYDRVVFLDPRSLIQRNPDALFACEGFCAAGAVYSPSSSPPFRSPRVHDPEARGSARAASPPLSALADGSEASDDDHDHDHDQAVAAAVAAVLEKPLSVPPSWQPSTSVMVIEPSLEVHTAMLNELTRTPAVGGLEAQVFLSSFLFKGTDAGERCTPFEDPVENASSTRRRSGRKGRGGHAGQWEDEGGGVFGAPAVGEGNGFGGGDGSFLENALMPVVLLNGPHIPRCSPGRERTAEGVCQRLPYTFAAPSTDFHGKNSWGAQDDEGAPEPHIVHFADEDTPWKRLAYVHKPLFSRWNAYRVQLEYPYGSFFAPWLLFFIPCAVLAFARVYYKTASGGSGSGASRASRAFPTDGSSPSKSRIPWLRSPTQLPHRQQQQVAILPACGIAAAYDGASTAGVGSLEAAAARFRNSAGDGGGGNGIAVGADLPCSLAGGEQQLPVGVCYVISALVGGFGLLWCRAAGALAHEVVDASWHPVISVSVHDAWLYCALVLGLYVLDYLHYALLTRGRTLLKDTMVVGAFVTAIRLLHLMKIEGEGSSSGAWEVIWAAAIGLGVVALGFSHGSRTGIVHHLSGRVHFRCVTASCFVFSVVSLSMCRVGPGAHTEATRRVQSAAATVHMVFIALVYASVIDGRCLRSGMDEAGSKMSRSCYSVSVGHDALIAAAPAKGLPSSASSPLSAHEISVGACASGVTGKGRCAWHLAWQQRRLVTSCITVMALWIVSVNLRPTNPVSHFEAYGQSCLESQAGLFVEAGGKRLSKVCKAEQALRPWTPKKRAYFEAFRQDKVCLEVAGGGFLTLGRVHVAQACLPEYQFVFQEVQSTRSSEANGRSGAAAGSAADGTEYCIYNPAYGFYLSAQGRPRSQCEATEHWRVRPAPRAPGLKGGKDGPLARSTAFRKAKSVLSVLLHPHFLSHGPLHTLYGYLLAATALLVARAVLSKLATSPCVAATSPSGSSSGGSHRHPRGLGARQRSRGRAHSRSHSSLGSFVDIGYLADAGYAGDAETGGGGYGAESSGNGSSKRVRSYQQPQLGSLGSAVVSRGPSVSPVAAGDRQLENVGWGADVTFTANRGDERRGAGDRGGRPRGGLPTSLKRKESSSSVVASSNDGWLAKVLSGLVVVCDATLLAGLWCLVPAHFAQAMSALTRDHHSAIDKGLGMDSNDAPADSTWSRSLGDSGVEAGSMAAVAFSCDNDAWWIMSSLVRWHLLFLLVAFCHLHGAVKAASSAGAQRWRSRRTDKKGAEYRRRTRSFWGLRSGERLAMRLRTAMGVLTLLLLLAPSLFPGKSALDAHPGWWRCEKAAGLDDSWGVVSPLLVFAVIAATCGVYLKAGSSFAVRSLACVALLATVAVVTFAAGQEYLILALAAVAIDWAAWAIAGVMSCVCYQSEPSGGEFCPTGNTDQVERESSGNTGGASDDLAGGGVASGCRGRASTGTSRGRGARQRLNEAALRISPSRWVAGLRGRVRNGAEGQGEAAATKSAASNLENVLG